MSKTGAPVQLLHIVYSPNLYTVHNKTGMKKCVFTDTLLFSNFYLALLFYLLVIPLLWPPNRLSLLHLT